VNARRIALLLVILGFGGAIETTWSIRNRVDIGPFGCRVLRGRFDGPSFTFEEQQHRPLGPATTLGITNAFGSVHLVGGDGSEVEVQLKKVVFAQTEERARAIAARVRLQAETSGDTLSIGTNREDVVRDEGDVGLETHLQIQMPRGTRLVLRNEHGETTVLEAGASDVDVSFGEVRVERVSGPLALKSRHGGVKVERVAGEVRLEARFGDLDLSDLASPASLDVEHGDVTLARVAGVRLKLAHGRLSGSAIGGDLDFEGQHAEVEVAEVAGTARVATSFNGVRLSRVRGDARVNGEHVEVHLEDVTGAAFVKTTFDGVNVTGVKGGLEAETEHGGIEARSIGKGARLHAAGGDVLLEDFDGQVTVESDRGDVRLVPTRPLVAALQVRSGHGDVSLDLPEGTRASIEARTERGNVSVEVPGFLAASTGEREVRGSLGSGGPEIKLAAKRGDVAVREAGPKDH
jgi:DUF4097 and DUF4098 domain-containing protein YvlB